MLAGEEAEADAAAGVIGVEVDEDDALPLAEGWIALLDGDGDRGADDGGQDVVSAVSERAVAVFVGKVTGEQPSEEVFEILLGAGADFDEGDAGGGMGDEDGEQATAPFAAKATELVCEVDDLSLGGVDVEVERLHS